MRYSVFLAFALAGSACNGVLGIEEATLCGGGTCDAGVVSEVAPGNPARPLALLDAGADAGRAPRGGITSEGVIQPGVTPVDMAGSGASGPSESSGDGDGDGDANDGDVDDGDVDDGSDGDGDGDDGEGPPPPPPPPPSPCAGRLEGEAFCTGAVRTSCGAGGAVSSSLPCASEAHCLEGSGGACAVCLTGEARCEGATLLACNATRSGLDTIPCASAAQCNAAAGRCEAPACVPGEARCDGAVLQTCNASLTGFDPVTDCGTPAACNAQTASCILCTPGARRCLDAVTVATCDASGQLELPSSCGVLEVCLNGVCEGLGAVPPVLPPVLPPGLPGF